MNWLLERGREPRSGIVIVPLDAQLAGSWKGATPMASAVLVPIAASDGERLGTLCLLMDRKAISTDEVHLLEALASHAALSLENFRRFSQLERSKRQWVEDIDAID